MIFNTQFQNNFDFYSDYIYESINYKKIIHYTQFENWIDEVPNDLWLVLQYWSMGLVMKNDPS